MDEFQIDLAVSTTATTTDPIIIPIGRRCLSAYLLTHLSLRHCSFPFDWVITDIWQVAVAIDDDLKDFYSAATIPPAYLAPDFKPNFYSLSIIRNRYGMCLPHVVNLQRPLQSQIAESVITMERRRQRLLTTLKGDRRVVFFLFHEVETAYDLQLFHHVIRGKYPSLRYKVVVVTHNPHGVETREQDEWSVRVVGNFPVNQVRGCIVPTLESGVAERLRGLLVGV